MPSPLLATDMSCYWKFRMLEFCHSSSFIFDFDCADVQECKTLRDFATSYTEHDHAKLLHEIWQADPETKAVRGHRGRLLSAWEAASTAIAKLEAAPVKPAGTSAIPSDLSWEAPLQEEDRNKSVGRLEEQVCRSYGGTRSPR